MGKTFWKGLAMPTFSHGSEIIYHTKTELQRLQVIDNKVHRGILRAPPSTATESLRGEIGASSSVARDMKNKLMFAKHCQREDTNDLVKHIFIQQSQNTYSKWIIQLNEYMNMLNLTLQKLKEMTFDEVKTAVHEWDTQMWREAATKKTSLNLYSKFKTEIKQEIWIDNGDEAKLMIRARTNTLELNNKNKHKGKCTTCPACKSEEEDLEHFLLHCAPCSCIRQDYEFLTRPYKPGARAGGGALVSLLCRGRLRLTGRRPATPPAAASPTASKQPIYARKVTF